jgi:hypothetical protein
MKDWRALPSKGGLIGIIFTGVAAVIFGLAVWVTVMAATATDVVQAVQSPDADPDTPAELLTIPTGNNIGTFFLALLCVVLLLVVIYLAYQTRKFFALRYSLDRNAIRVNLGDSQQVIPLANVRYMLPAEVVLARAKERGKNAADLDASANSARAEAGTASAPANESPRRPGGSTKAYPRKAAPPASIPDLDDDMVEVEVAEPDAERPYQMTQTAAADSDLDHLESLEFETAEFVEVSDAGAERSINPARTESEDYDEQPAQALNPREFRTLAINFEEGDGRDKGDDGAPDQSGNPREGTIPDQTETVTTATEIESDQVSRRPFSSWPGFYLNKTKLPALGTVQFFSTHQLEGTLLIRTERQTYAISPRDRQQFITEFNLRKRLGAIEPVQEGIIKGPLLSHPLWHDNLGRGLIALGIILNMFIYFSLLLRYNDFPDILRIHFNKVGQVDRLGDRGELFLLPLIGLVTIIANNILGAFLQLKEAIPAYLLYAAGVLVQVLVGIALVVILIVS